MGCNLTKTLTHKKESDIISTWQANLYNGVAKVEIIPVDNNYMNEFNQKFILYADGVYLGEFPTYTQALEHTITIINDME